MAARQTTQGPQVRPVPVAQGGTGAATAADARTALDVPVTAHQHVAADVTDLGGAAVLEVGTSADTVAAGDDARLSDARTPTAHNQDASTITTGTLAVARGGTGIASPGASGNVLTSDGAGGWNSSAPAGGLTAFTEAEDTASPNATVNVDSLTAAASTTNADAAIVPKGSGAFLVEIPDGTSAGGNKRGTYASDLQHLRTDAAMVASGVLSSIGGGQSNTASGTRSRVGGGAENTAGPNGYSTAAGGQGNTASGAHSAIGGGQNNTTSGSHANVGGGSGNTASTTAAVGGGSSNSASGTNSSIGGGNANTASANYSAVPGGRSNTADGAYSHVGGYQSTARGIQARESFANGQRATLGDAQRGTLVTRKVTTDATPTSLTSGGGTAAASTVNVLPDNHVYAVRAQVTAREPATGDVSVWEIAGAAKRGANAAATALVGTPTVTLLGADAGASTWAVDLIVNTTRGSVEIEATGEAGKTIAWVGTMYTTECG